MNDDWSSCDNAIYGGRGFHSNRQRPWGHGGEVIAECDLALRLMNFLLKMMDFVS